MIVILDGAFGVGKTTAAKGLLARIPDRMLYDPEDVGQMLRTIDACNRPAEANPPELGVPPNRALCRCAPRLYIIAADTRLHSDPALNTKGLLL